MSPRRLLYSLAVGLAMPPAVARLAWRGRRQPGYRAHIGERFGATPALPPGPVLWIHAVSVGETQAAQPLVEALLEGNPQLTILLTHMTPTGRETGERLFGARVRQAYLPYDLPWAVRRFLARAHPCAGLLLETEIWPNLIAGCRQAGIPLFLVNARLSERSARRYGRVAGLTRETLARLAGIGAQSEADARRLQALGAGQVVVTGNLKFDRGPAAGDVDRGRALRARLGTQRPVFLAASTRDGEEELLLDALAQAAPPGLLTVLVPRHPQRFEAVARLLQRRGVRFARRSDNGTVDAGTQVLLGDSMGELYTYYAACDVAFVGGSLQPLGGQNLLEAAAVGCPALVGPHTFNFTEATRLALEAGAARRAADAGAVVAELLRLLPDAAGRAAMGAAGLALMARHQGATARTLALLPPDCLVSLR